MKPQDTSWFLNNQISAVCVEVANLCKPSASPLTFFYSIFINLNFD